MKGDTKLRTCVLGVHFGHIYTLHLHTKVDRYEKYDGIFELMVGWLGFMAYQPL